MSCLARPGEAWAPAGQDIVSQGIVTAAGHATTFSLRDFNSTMK